MRGGNDGFVAAINTFNYNGLFDISLSLNKSEDVVTEVYNALGVKIQSHLLKGLYPEKKEQLDLSTYSDGIYIIQAITSEKRMSQKIVIQH